MELGASQLISVVFATVILDLLLDGDNALIIAAMVRHLPQDQAIPWPRWILPLKPLTRLLPPVVRRLNDNQQNAALQLGIAGAIAGRLALLLITGVVIQYPIFTLLGAAYLIQLGARHLAKREVTGDDSGEAEHQSGKWGFWRTGAAVNMVDVAFSLDNVVALVALTKDMVALTLGIGLAVVLMRFAAVLFIKIMRAHPVLEPAAYVLVLYLGIQIILEHEGILKMNEVGKAGMLAGIVVMALAYEKAVFLHPVCRPIFHGLSVILRLGVAILDGVFRAATWPLRAGWRAARTRV